MRILLLAIIILAGLSPSGEADGSLVVADAREAAVLLPHAPHGRDIADNYGDPDRFVKYIIRKPPVLV